MEVVSLEQVYALITRIRGLSDPFLNQETYSLELQRIQEDVLMLIPFVSPDHHAIFLDNLLNLLSPTLPNRVKAAIPVIVATWIAGGGIEALLCPVDLAPAFISCVAVLYEKERRGPEGSSLHSKSPAEVTGVMLELDVIPIREKITHFWTHLSCGLVPTDAATEALPIVTAPASRPIGDPDRIIQLLVSLPDRLLPILHACTYPELRLRRLGAIVMDETAEASPAQALLELGMVERMLASKTCLNHVVAGLNTGIAVSSIPSVSNVTTSVRGTPYASIQTGTSDLGYPEFCLSLMDKLVALQHYRNLIENAVVAVVQLAILDASILSLGELEAAFPLLPRAPFSQAVFFTGSETASPLHCTWLAAACPRAPRLYLGAFLTALRSAMETRKEVVAFMTLVQTVSELACTPYGHALALARSSEAKVLHPFRPPLQRVDFVARFCVIAEIVFGRNAVLPPGCVDQERAPTPPPWRELMPFVPMTMGSQTCRTLTVDLPLQGRLPPIVCKALAAFCFQGYRNGEADLYLQASNLRPFIQAWGAKEYICHTESTVQASASRFLAAELHHAPREVFSMSQDVLTLLMEAINNRMDSGTAAVRGGGLLVAQTLSAVLPDLSTGVSSAIPPAPLDFQGDQDFDHVASAGAEIETSIQQAVDAISAKLYGSLAEHSAAHIDTAGPELHFGCNDPKENCEKPELSASTLPPETYDAIEDRLSIPPVSVAAFVYTGSMFVRDAGHSNESASSMLKAKALLNSPAIVMAQKLARLAPTSLADALDALTSSDGPSPSNSLPVPGDTPALEAPPPDQRHIAALCSLPRMVRLCAGADGRAELLSLTSPSLVGALLTLDNRYNIPEFENWRLASLTSLAVVGGSRVSDVLVRKFFGNEISEGTRMEVLDVVVQSVRELIGAGAMLLPETPWDAADDALRKESHSDDAFAALRTEKIPEWKPAGVDPYERISSEYFFPLLTGLVQRGGGSGGWSLKDDDILAALTLDSPFAVAPRLLSDASASRMLGQLIKASAIMMEACAGHSPGSQMLRTFMPLCFLLRAHADSDVRVGMLAGLAACLSCVHQKDILSLPSILEPVLNIEPFGAYRGRVPALIRADENGSDRPAMFLTAGDDATVVSWNGTDGKRPDEGGPDSDDEDGVVGAQSTSELECPLQVLTSVGQQVKVASQKTAVVQLLKGGPARTTQDLLARAPQSSGTSASDPLQAALASLSDKRTVWDDVLSIVDCFQSIAKSDPDQRCRAYAAELVANPIIQDVTVRPLAALHLLTANEQV